MKFKIFFFLLLSSIFWREGEAVAQCCSAGNPIGGTANMGILSKKTLRTILFYRYALSDTYYQGASINNFTFVDKAYYNYVSGIFNYGLTGKFNAETEIGYFINRTQIYNPSIISPPDNEVKGSGFSNGVVSLKYNVYNNTPKQFEFTAGIGGKFPFHTQYQSVNNTELPQDVQPSTAAFGIVAQTFFYKGFVENGWRLFLLNRFETNFPNYKNYQIGNAYFTSLFVSKSINHNWTAILQIRNEIRDKDIRNANNGSISEQKIASSGGVLLFVSPQINYTIAQQWNISLLADVPVYKNYYGNQLGSKFSFAILLLRDFDFGSPFIPTSQHPKE